MASSVIRLTWSNSFTTEKGERERGNGLGKLGGENTDATSPSPKYYYVRWVDSLPDSNTQTSSEIRCN